MPDQATMDLIRSAVQSRPTVPRVASNAYRSSSEDGIISRLGRVVVPLAENTLFQLQRPMGVVSDFVSSTGLAIGVASRLYGEGVENLDPQELARLMEDIEQMGRLARRGLGTLTPFGGYDGREGGKFFGTNIEDVGGFGLGPENVLDVINRTSGFEGTTIGDTALGRTVASIGLPERMANFINQSTLFMPFRIPAEVFGPDLLNWVKFLSLNLVGETAEALSKIDAPPTSSSFLTYRLAELTVPALPDAELVRMGRELSGNVLPDGIRAADVYFKELAEANMVTRRLRELAGKSIDDIVSEARVVAESNPYAAKVLEVYDNANMIESTIGPEALRYGDTWAERAERGQLGFIVSRSTGNDLMTGRFITRQLPTGFSRVGTVAGAGTGYTIAGPVGGVVGGAAGNVLSRIAEKYAPETTRTITEAMTPPSADIVGRAFQSARKKEASDIQRFTSEFIQKNIEEPLEEISAMARKLDPERFGGRRQARETVSDIVRRESERVIQARGTIEGALGGPQNVPESAITRLTSRGTEDVVGFEYKLVEELPDDLRAPARAIVDSVVEFTRRLPEIESKLGVTFDPLGSATERNMVDTIHSIVKRTSERQAGVLRRLDAIAADASKIAEYGEDSLAVALNRVDDIVSYVPMDSNGEKLLNSITDNIKKLQGSFIHANPAVRKKFYDVIKNLTPSSSVEDFIVAQKEIELLSDTIRKTVDPTEVFPLSIRAERAMAEWMSVPEYILHIATPEFRRVMAKKPGASGAMSRFVNDLSELHTSLNARRSPIEDIDQVEAIAHALYPELKGPALQHDLSVLMKERWRRVARSIRNEEAVNEIKRHGRAVLYGETNQSIEGLVRSNHRQFKILDEEGKEIGAYFFKKADADHIDRYYGRLGEKDAQRRFLDHMAQYGNFFKKYALLWPSYHFKNHIGASWSNFLMGVTPQDYGSFLPLYAARMVAEMDDQQLAKYISGLSGSVIGGAGGAAIAAGQDDSDFVSIIGGAITGAAIGTAGGAAFGAIAPLDATGLRSAARQYLEGTIQTAHGPMSRGRLIERLEGEGALGSGLYAIDVDADMERRVRRSGDVTHGQALLEAAMDNPAVQLNQRLGTVIENIHRGALAMKTVREGGGLRDAATNVFMAHFDYDDLTDWQKDILRHPFFGMPFATFTLKNIPFQFTEGLLRQPGKNRLAMNVVRGYQEEVGGGGTPLELREWMYDRFPMVTDRDPVTGEVHVFTGDGWFTFTDFEKAVDPSILLEEFATGVAPIPMAAQAAITGVDIRTGRNYNEEEVGGPDVMARLGRFIQQTFRPAREAERLYGGGAFGAEEPDFLRRIARTTTGRTFSVDPASRQRDQERQLSRARTNLTRRIADMRASGSDPSEVADEYRRGSDELNQMRRDAAFERLATIERRQNAQ